MDQIVAQAMTLYGKIAGLKRKEASVITVPARTSKGIIYPLHVANGKTNATRTTNGTTTGTRVSNIDSVS
jgi:hypothetical protein